MSVLAQTAGPAAPRARHGGDRRADAARPDLRPGHRRPDRRQRVLALDLLRQHPDRDPRPRRSPPGCCTPTPAAPTPAGSTGAACCCSRPALAGIVFGLSETETQGGIDARRSRGCRSSSGSLLVALFVRHALRAERPLIDVGAVPRPASAPRRRRRSCSAARCSARMIVLPLYYQVDRGESALTAGLLMAPQGIGAALAMPFAGRLTDRIGGGPRRARRRDRRHVATIPFASVGGDHARTRCSRRCSSSAASGSADDDAGDGGRVRDAHARGRAARDERAQRRCSASAARSARRCWRSSCSARSPARAGRRRRSRGAGDALRDRRAAGRRVRPHVLVGRRASPRWP